ncbi:hypothetical protein [Crocinitomix catalasitica]|uniref:hypothetical protein n=1 Tax=Crocinitomix catalasitica TaxID=184607 RepID=UPI000484313D|nr:hypothetical protein [Crocinitomix catalasitica]
MSTIHAQSIHEKFISVWMDLVNFKALDDQKSFNNLMLAALPEMEKYVASRLRLAHNRGQLPEGKYEVSDFTNDLFIAAYDEFARFKTANEFSNWLYIKMDELIEDQIVEEDFDDFFFNDFGNYSTDEWQALEDKIDTSDKTGKVELKMSDSAITKSGEKVLAEIFKTDAERQQLEQIRNEVGDKGIASHLNLVMNQLAPLSAVTLNLVVEHGVTPKDAAEIKQISENEIEADIKKSKGHILDSFASRFRNIVF